MRKYRNSRLETVTIMEITIRKKVRSEKKYDQKRILIRGDEHGNYD